MYDDYENPLGGYPESEPYEPDPLPEHEPMPISSEVKHAAVIDKDGYYVDLVQVTLNEYADGVVETVVNHYTLQAGESLVYEGISNAIGMGKARWVDGAWIDEDPPEPQPHLGAAAGLAGPTPDSGAVAVPWAHHALLGQGRGASLRHSRHLVLAPVRPGPEGSRRHHRTGRGLGSFSGRRRPARLAAGTPDDD